MSQNINKYKHNITNNNNSITNIHYIVKYFQNNNKNGNNILPHKMILFQD